MLAPPPPPPPQKKKKKKNLVIMETADVMSTDSKAWHIF